MPLQEFDSQWEFRWVSSWSQEQTPATAITQLPSASAGGCSITRDSALATSRIFLLAKAQNIHPTVTPGLKAGAIINFTSILPIFATRY